MRKFLKREKPILLTMALALYFVLWTFNSGCANAKIADTAKMESRKETSIDAYEQNAASAEMLKADSVIIVKYDTITKENTLVKYYGIQKTKTDTVYLARKAIEIIRDTVYEKEKISEKSEESLLKKILDAFGFVLIFVGLVAMIWGIRRIMK